MARHLTFALLAFSIACACGPGTPDDTGGGGGGVGGGGSPRGGGAGGGHHDAGTGGGSAAPVDCNGVANLTHKACASADQPGGICLDNACLPCTDPGDDAACATAYGSPAICDRGVCVHGSCHADTDCAGKLCQLPTHVCVKCTVNLQCPGNRCDTASGTCVAATCTGESSVCGNGGAICCGGACVAGACCSAAECTGMPCVNHLCTACTGVTCVDPTGGDDALATACCFKTLTRALESLQAADGGTVELRGDIGVGEAFPLRLPAGVTVTSDATPRTVFVPANTYAFELAAQSSGLRNLTLDNGGGGVRVLAGTNFAFNALAGVTITHMVDDGVRVEAGGVALDGTFAQNLNGLHVLGGTARVAPAAAGSAHFDQNLQHGITVELGGGLIIGGTTADGGNVTANGNGGSGLQLLNAIGSVPPFQRLIGLVATGNTLDGIRLGANSNLSQVQGNVLLGNHRSGLSVRDFSGTGAGVNLNGHSAPNMLQSTDNPNLGAGLCFDTYTTFSVNVDASNNRFSTADCSLDAGASPPVLSRSRTCTGGVDVGGVPQLDGGGEPNPVHVTLNNCQSI